jgi:hypothetical protein
MLKIIAIVVQAAAVAGGAYVGFSLKGGGEDGASQESDEAADKDDEGKKDGKDKSNTDKQGKDKRGKSKDGKKKGGKDGDYADGSSGYMKFSRQFIVPVVRRDSVNALVILEINLELHPSATESAYTREPKVRDALLSSLLQLSNEGAFNEQLLAQENLEGIRARLLESAKGVLGDDVIGVLILSVARQDI